MSTDPISDFASARQAIEAILASEKQQPGLKYPALALLHDRPTSRSIVFLHGFTNSPHQFSLLGQRFFDLGYNVWIPRQPQHGFVDRTGAALRSFQIDRYLAECSQAVDIGCRLGQKLTVVGLSGGANASIWLAQNRPEIDLAVVMAPSLGVQFVPSPLTRAAVLLLNLAPDMLIWWDGKTREANPESPDFAYTAFATRAMGQMLKLGQSAKKAGRKNKARARQMLVISSAGDRAVNQTEIRQLIRYLQKFSAVTAYEIPLAENVGHDFISPGQGRNEALYARLIDLIQAAENKPGQAGSFST